MKVIMILGFCRGLRGNDEHVNLKTHNFEVFKFGKKYKKWEGLTGVRLKEIPHDKTHKLGFNNCVVRDEKDSVPFPVLSDGVTGNVAQDLGGPIVRMLKLLKEDERCDRFYRKVKEDGSAFCAQPVGKNTFPKLVRNGFKRLGISNWETLRPHAMRSECISVVANSDKAIGDKQKLRATRHKNMQSHQSYQKVGASNIMKHVEAMVGDIEVESTTSDVKMSCKPSPKKLSSAASSSSFKLSPNKLSSAASMSTGPAQAMNIETMVYSPSVKSYPSKTGTDLLEGTELEFSPQVEPSQDSKSVVSTFNDFPEFSFTQEAIYNFQDELDDLKEDIGGAATRDTTSLQNNAQYFPVTPATQCSEVKDSTDRFPSAPSGPSGVSTYALQDTITRILCTAPTAPTAQLYVFLSQLFKKFKHRHKRSQEGTS